jgi:hypothetical protein
LTQDSLWCYDFVYSSQSISVAEIEWWEILLFVVTVLALIFFTGGGTSHRPTSQEAAEAVDAGSHEPNPTTVFPLDSSW